MANKSAVRHCEGVCTKVDEDEKIKKRRQRWAYGDGFPEDFDYHLEFEPERFEARRTAYNKHETCPDRDAWFMALTKIFESCAAIHEGCEECGYLGKCSEIHNALSDRGRDRFIKDREATEFVMRFLKMLIGVK